MIRWEVITPENYHWLDLSRGCAFQWIICSHSLISKGADFFANSHRCDIFRHRRPHRFLAYFPRLHILALIYFWHSNLDLRYSFVRSALISEIDGINSARDWWHARAMIPGDLSIHGKFRRFCKICARYQEQVSSVLEPTGQAQTSPDSSLICKMLVSSEYHGAKPQSAK